MPLKLNPADEARERVVGVHRERLKALVKNRVMPEGKEHQTRGEALASLEAMTPEKRQELLEMHGAEGVFKLLGRQQ